MPATTLGAVSTLPNPGIMPAMAFPNYVTAPAVASPLTLATQSLAAPVTTFTAPATTMVAAPATTMLAAPATTMLAAPALNTNAVKTVMLPQSTSMLAYPTQTYQASQIFNQSPYQYQFLPTASSVAMPAQVAAVTTVAASSLSKATGDALRVTICPIKEDSENAMTKFLNGKEVAAGIAGLSGLKLGEAFFADSNLVVIAKYDNMENLETGSAVNAKLMGQVAENLAGAPTRYSGEAFWSYKGRGSSTDEVANRITILPIKPGSEAAIDELTKIIELKLDDKTFDEVIDITSFFSEGKKLVVVARYSNMKALEAASEKAAALMKDMAQFAAGAPDRFSGSLAWTAAADAPKKKKKAKKAKKGCC